MPTQNFLMLLVLLMMNLRTTDDSMVEILKFGKISRLKFGQVFEANIFFGFRPQGIVAILKLKFTGYVEVWSIFRD